MKFLAMVLAVLVHWRERPPPLAWPARWVPMAGATPTWSGLAIAVAAPAAVAWLVLGLIGGWLWGLAGLLFHCLVLIGCLGGSRWGALFDTLVADGYRGDLQAALHALDQLEGPGVAGEVADAAGLCDAADRALAMSFVREWFAVLFWFVLFGAPGALLYRCLERVAASTGSGAALLAVLEWPALRAFGLVAALGGRTSVALGPWARSLGSLDDPAALAGRYVSRGLDRQPEEEAPGRALAARVRALQTLFGRAVLAWLALVAAVWILL